MAVVCEACKRKFYESLIRNCPKKVGHFICLYCCKKCKNHYRADGGGIWGCRAFDEQKAAEDAMAAEKEKEKREKRKKNNH